MNAPAPSWVGHEAVYDRFERAWAETGPPDLADFLPPAGDPERGEILHELIRIDLELRWQHGQHTLIETYVEKFPELREQGAVPPELILHELTVRRDVNALPLSGELTERFGAEMSRQLRAQVHLHETNAAPEETLTEKREGSHALLSQPQDTGPGGTDLPGGSVVVPRRLGRYEVLEPIGQGGFATVYRGRDTKLEREVALKVPRDMVFDQDVALERFRREAQSAARLRHPAIVTLHEVNEEAGLTYLVYDYVPGQNLAAILKETRPAADQAAQWLARIADALEYAHQQGIVHRDVKPANILMDRDGQPMLADFGLAAAEGGLTLTQQGDILGTPAYMSPEQASGKSHKVDARSDVYSLGVVLYEMLCGATPFQGSGASVLHQVIYNEPAPPHSRHGGIPVDLETICLKAMAKEPAGRYTGAGEMAADLRRYLAREPIQARRISMVSRLARWCRRNPALAGTIATAVAVIMLVAGVSFHRVVDERNRAERLAADLALDRGIALCEQDEVAHGLLWMARALELAPGGAEDLRNAILANVGAWREALVQPELIQELPSNVHSALVATTDPKMALLMTVKTSVQVVDVAGGQLVGSEIRPGNDFYRATLAADNRFVFTADSHGVIQRWDVRTGKREGEPIQHGGSIYCLACDPLGEWILAAGPEKIQRYELATGRPAGPAWRCEDGILCAEMSPDAKVLATGGPKGIERWDVIRGTRMQRLRTGDIPCHRVVFSSAGHFLAAYTRDGAWHLFSTRTGKLLKSWTSLGFGMVRPVAFDSHERYFAAVTSGKDVRVWDLQTQEYAGPLLVHKGSINDLAFRGDGKVLVTACTDRTAQLWDIASGKRVAAPLVHAGVIRQVVVSPDGKFIWTCSEEPCVRVWNAAGTLGAPRLLHHPFAVCSAVYSQDGTMILSGCGTRDSEPKQGSGHLWNATTLEPLLPPMPHRAKLDGVAISPDGKTLITAGHDNDPYLYFWDTATGRKLDAVMGSVKYGFYSLAMSPDGKWLVTGNAIDKFAQGWDPTTHRPTLRFPHGGAVRSLAFTSDSKWLCTGSYDKTARVWNAETGEPVSEPFLHHGEVGAVDISGDGRRVVTGNDARTAQVWDVQTGKAVGPPLPHQGTVRSVTFHPDGRYILTASWDKTARLWDPKTGKQIGPPLRHDAEVEVARFSPDGQTILTGSWDKTIRLWPLPATMSGDAAQIKAWIEVATGIELEESGNFHVLDAETWRRRRDSLQKLGFAP